MHVAQFVHRYPPAFGGAEAWTERLSKYLTSQGHSVTVWTTTAIDLTAFAMPHQRETEPGTRVEDGITIRRYRPEFRFPGRKYLFKALSLFPVRRWQAMTVPWSPTSLSMWNDAGRETTRIDVVHALAFPYSSLARSALRLARRHRVPFVLTPFLHLGDPNNPRDWIRRAYMSPHLRWLLNQADRVIVQTPTEGEAVRSTGVASDRIVLQGLGVDPRECTGGNREEARSTWRVQPDEVVVGHLANLSLEKGSPDVVGAVKSLRKEGLSVRAVLAGSQMPSFRQFWNRTDPVDWITLTGVLNDRQRRDFFAGIDVFALPSISDSFGLVFLEAWANGVPVIGYRAGGVVDVIRHERDGLLVRCGDVQALAEAMRRLVGDGELRSTWGRAGRERCAAEFSWRAKLEIAADALTFRS